MRGRWLGGSRKRRLDCAQAGVAKTAGKTNAAAKAAGSKVAPNRVLMGVQCNLSPQRSKAGICSKTQESGEAWRPGHTYPWRALKRRWVLLIT
jgi:hypothetical protein